MKIRTQRGLILLITAMALLDGAAHASPKDQCLACHGMLADKPSALFRQDIHHQKGITCAGCHGGDATTDDMDAAMNTAGGFIGVLKDDEISRACAACHSDAERMKQYNSTLSLGQLQQLEQSVHGKLAVSGGKRIAQCTTCHGAHGILPVKNPRSPVAPLNVVKTCAGCHANAGYIQSYNPKLPVDQLEKYRTSVHGALNAKGDAKVAECASCHGGHDILSASDVRSRTHALNLPQVCAGCHSNAGYMKQYGIPTDQYDAFARSVHGIALLEKRDVGAPACNDCHGNHGATPPGVESISKVCGTCHALNADLFSASPHKKAFDDLRLPECETCHGNHEIVAATNALLGTAPDAVCSSCHSEGEESRGYQMAAAFRSLADSLTSLEDSARVLVDAADQKGMDIVDLRFKLRDVRQARLELRTIVHSLDDKKFDEVASRGLATASVVRTEAAGAVDEYFFRRIGLGVATLIISILAISLYLYIRRLERAQQQTPAA